MRRHPTARAGAQRSRAGTTFKVYLLATVLQESHPESRVLFMSGYTEHAMIHHGVRGRTPSFLPKPFTADVLMGKVRDALAGCLP